MLPSLKVYGKPGDYPSPVLPRPPGSQPRRRPRQKRRRLRSAAQEPPVVLNYSLKMADPTFAGTSNSTSFRGLRERLVAMAQELAEERRRKHGTDSSAVTKKKSSCTPDGSVLKNDVKQQLAKERREERKRQQEASKEKQLLEKEQKAKLQYEKQLEEKLRKLKEQKEKDERRRASAEEKRKQKQAEDKEKFKAVVSRTMERCNRIDQQQKRWSWEGGMMNAGKSGKPENKRSSSLSKKDNNRSYHSANLQPVDVTPSTTKYFVRYVSVPMFTSDELKSAMFCKTEAPSLQARREAHLEASVGGQRVANVEGSPQNPEMDKRNINLTTKKPLLCHMPCYRWPSSPALECSPLSSIKALQSRKIRPPSPLPVSSRLSTKNFLSFKITPIQNILRMSNALDVVTAKKETIQKHMIIKESDNKNMPSGDVAKKSLIQVYHAAYEQKSKKEKERVQKEETKQSIARKSEAMAEKLDKVPAEEYTPHKEKRQEINPTKILLESPEGQMEQLQKKDSAMMKSQGSAEQRKKEREKIMLQYLKERAERRKALEMSSSSEDEADDERETGSEDSFEVFPSGGKISVKLKKFHKDAKTRPQKLVFLQAGAGEVETDKNVYFSGITKAVKQKDPQYPTIQGKGTKLPARKIPTHPIRSRKIKEGGTTIRPTQSDTTNQEWVYDRVIDLSQITEQPVVKTSPGSNIQSSTDSMRSRQSPQAHLDHKKRAKCVSVPLTKVLSQLHIAGRATTLEHPFASVYSRLAFRGEVEESAESVDM
ncbi:MAP7 domain-containing protein 3 [Mastomys coucha]|uniref:MAP7 domain-containing protein 3 n=1 Tax=Mastomys coucha TaxID=35658 RepID=UPI0012621F65|nr:MAP7 domain-containing protein 3 [Mastomys coucha]